MAPVRPSPILWPGDKTLLEDGLLRWVAPLEPKGRVLDPFCGSVALHMKHGYPLLLGDINSHLVDLLLEIQQTPPERMRDRVRDLFDAEDPVFDRAVALLDHKWRWRRATAFLYLLRSTRFPHVRYNRSGRYNMNFHHAPRYPEAEMGALHERLKGAWIREGDYHWVLERAKEGDCIFLDPPYHECKNMYNKPGDNLFDFCDLMRVVKGLRSRGMRVVLTLEDREEARTLTKDADHRFTLERLTNSCYLAMRGSRFRDLVCIYQRGLKLEGADNPCEDVEAAVHEDGTPQVDGGGDDVLV